MEREEHSFHRHICKSEILKSLDLLLGNYAGPMGATFCLAFPAALRVGTVLFLSRFPVSDGLVILLDVLYRLCGWSWSGILTYELLEKGGGSLWVPILYCLCLLAAELALAWLAWKRRDRR